MRGWGLTDAGAAARHHGHLGRQPPATSSRRRGGVGSGMEERGRQLAAECVQPALGGGGRRDHRTGLRKGVHATIWPARRPCWIRSVLAARTDESAEISKYLRIFR